jgi:hypothetical protein
MSEIFSTPSTRDDLNASNSDQENQQNRNVSFSSPPSFVANGVSIRPKPRLFGSSSHNSSASPNSSLLNARNLYGEIDLKIDRDRAANSSNKNTETRVRKELEESQVRKNCILIPCVLSLCDLFA